MHSMISYAGVKNRLARYRNVYAVAGSSLLQDGACNRPEVQTLACHCQGAPSVQWVRYTTSVKESNRLSVNRTRAGSQLRNPGSALECE